MHRLGYLVTGFIALSYRNVNCSSTQQAGTKLLILFKIRAGRKMCHSIYFAKEKSFLAFLLLFFFVLEKVFPLPAPPALHPPHPTGIMSHLAQEILIFLWKKKIVKQPKVNYFGTSLIYCSSNTATTPPARSTQPGNSCPEDVRQRSQSKLVGLPSRTHHFPAQRKAGLPPGTHMLVYSLLLQWNRRFPIGPDGFFIIRFEWMEKPTETLDCRVVRHWKRAWHKQRLQRQRNAGLISSRVQELAALSITIFSPSGTSAVPQLHNKPKKRQSFTQWHPIMDGTQVTRSNLNDLQS